MQNANRFDGRLQIIHETAPIVTKRMIRNVSNKCHCIGLLHTSIRILARLLWRGMEREKGSGRGSIVHTGSVVELWPYFSVQFVRFGESASYL